MSLWQRLFGPRVTPRAGVSERGYDQSRQPSEPIRTIPTVKFDPSRVTEEVKSDLRRNIQRIKEFDGTGVNTICEAALRSIAAGGDMASLFDAIMRMNIEGMTKQRAEAVTRHLHDKATALMNRERQESLGIEYAVWLYSGAPCFKNPKNPSQADIRRNTAHKAADGKRFKLSRGLLLNGKWTRPGQQDGCRCSSRSVIPGLD